jgi:hypothetical protein
VFGAAQAAAHGSGGEGPQEEFRQPQAQSPHAQPQISYGQPRSDWGAPPGPASPSPYPRGHGQYAPGVVPPELQGGWNWGAFFFSWIWGLNHKAYITLLVLALGLLAIIPYAGVFFSFVQLGLIIWFGTQGNKWAWMSGRFSSVEHCRQVQRIWAYWALGVFLFTVLVGIAVGLIVLVALAEGQF